MSLTNFLAFKPIGAMTLVPTFFSLKLFSVSGSKIL